MTILFMALFVGLLTVNICYAKKMVVNGKLNLSNIDLEVKTAELSGEWEFY